MEKFLEREVKKDSKGVYIHLGGCRLRPTTKRTSFNEGDLVSMIHEYNQWSNPLTRSVFNNSKEYEIWQTKK